LRSTRQLQVILNRYAAGLAIQVAQTGACNRLHKIGLARDFRVRIRKPAITQSRREAFRNGHSRGPLRRRHARSCPGLKDTLHRVGLSIWATSRSGSPLPQTALTNAIILIRPSFNMLIKLQLRNEALLRGFYLQCIVMKRCYRLFVTAQRRARCESDPFEQ
jgi:hypothetical protein